MASKKQKTVIGVVGIIIAIAVLFFIYSNYPLAVTSTTFTPVFCNDYEFTCCNEIKNPSQPVIAQISDESWYQCPRTATRCEILAQTFSSTFAGDVDWYVGSANCRLTQTLLSGDYLECDNDIRHKIEMLPSDIVFVRNGGYPKGVNINAQLQVQVYDDRLDFTGRASSTTGVPVSGADGCKFNPSGGKIYTSSSLTNSLSVFSYTVPLGQCVLSWQGQDRHICGYKEEGCSSNTDCQAPVCTARTLQTYGCKSFGTVITSKDTLDQGSAGGDSPDDSKTSANTFGKRCEIISAQQVQCCGDTDCGTNYRCDTPTHTCKPANQVQCTQNYDCGVNIQCDAFAKKLKTPVCNSGVCGFNEFAVDCCSDLNCPSDSYCSVDRKCVQKQAEKQLCPNECCESDNRYFDRLCPDAKPFCQAGTCSTTQNNFKECSTCWGWLRNKVDSGYCSEGLIAKYFLNPTKCIFYFVKLGFLTIASLLGFFFVANFLNKIEAFKKIKYLSWFLSFIITSIFAIVGYLIINSYLFWIILIFLIILNFGLNLVPRRI